MKLKDRIKLFKHGLKAVETKGWYIVWDKKTGIPVNYYLPFIKKTEEDEVAKVTAEKAFIERLNVIDYCRPFMTKEEVKAFNDERKQHLKEKIKKVDEEIEKNKDKPVNFPTNTDLNQKGINNG